jgi:phage protein D/phage baseplate assembly protein gpV
MLKPSELASQIDIKLDGTRVQQSIMRKVDRVVVDQHSHLPDMFTIRLHDEDLELLDDGPFDLTRSVTIEATKRYGDQVTLIQGEITALEPSFDEGMIAELVVRGYDRSHRLYRQTKSKSHLNKTDADLAGEIAREAGLRAEIDPTKTVYEHVYQHNQSDLTFLMQRAWRIGYECFVADDTLHFRRPSSGSAAATLTWGDDLLSFRPRMTLAEQVDEVVVKGWDVEGKRAIVGRAHNGRLYPKTGESRDGSSWASTFGSGKRVIVDQPVVSQAEADILAAARLDEISGAFLEAEGVAFRRPEIRAGRMVTLKALGQRLSGSYLVTSATHVYSAEGLTTTFAVRGSRTGLLTEQMMHRLPQDRWPGVVTAVVTNTDDPEDWGRVKVKFPWMADDAESDWARVVGIGAGQNAGLFVMPLVGDEVLVAFAHGDFGQPFVLGGLWNGQHDVPPPVLQAPSGEKPLVRTWHSAGGHRITVYDNAEKKIEIATADGNNITLDDAQREIRITGSGRKITIESKGGIEICAKQGNIEIDAGTGNVNIQGATINLN